MDIGNARVCCVTGPRFSGGSPSVPSCFCFSRVRPEGRTGKELGWDALETPAIAFRKSNGESIIQTVMVVLRPE
jgi:hypothetical protein